MNLELFFVITAHFALIISLFLIYPILINTKKTTLKTYKR